MILLERALLVGGGLLAGIVVGLNLATMYPAPNYGASWGTIALATAGALLFSAVGGCS